MYIVYRKRRNEKLIAFSLCCFKSVYICEPGRLFDFASCCNYGCLCVWWLGLSLSESWHKKKEEGKEIIFLDFVATLNL